MTVGNAQSREGTVLIFGKNPSDESAGTSAGSTTSTTFIDVEELTWTPASSKDYLVMCYSKFGNSKVSRNTEVQVLDDKTATVYTKRTIKTSQAVDRIPYFTMFKLTGVSTEQTIKIQARTNVNDNTVSYDASRIIAIDLSNFDNHYYAESRGLSNTTSTTFQNKLTLSESSPEDNWHGVIYSWTARSGGFPTPGRMESRGVENNIAIHTPVTRGVNVIDNTFPVQVSRIRPQNNTNTWDIEFRLQIAGGNANITDAAICVFELPSEGSVRVHGANIFGNTRLK